jgi:hypothetical protein
MDWVQSRPQGFNCASAHSSENAYHKPWFSFFVRRTEHFRLPLRGVNHAEWLKDEHENTPTETGSVICCPLKAVVIERPPPRTRLSQRAKKLSAISGARPCRSPSRKHSRGRKLLPARRTLFQVDVLGQRGDIGLCYNDRCYQKRVICLSQALSDVCHERAGNSSRKRRMKNDDVVAIGCCDYARPTIFARSEPCRC